MDHAEPVILMIIQCSFIKTIDKSTNQQAFINHQLCETSYGHFRSDDKGKISDLGTRAF